MATPGSPASVHILPKGFHTLTPYIMLGANVKADEFIEFFEEGLWRTEVLGSLGRRKRHHARGYGWATPWSRRPTLIRNTRRRRWV